MRRTAEDIQDRMRSAEHDSWSYLVPDLERRQRARWFSEKEILPHVLPTVLDSFHAIQEIQRVQPVPKYAQRRDVAKKARRCTSSLS